MNKKRIIIIISIVVLIIINFCVIFINVPFKTKLSRNGRYKAALTSPERNLFKIILSSGDLNPIRGCQIIFNDTEDNKTLWKWQQMEGDSIPEDLIPTDNGYLIVQDSVSNYFVFNTEGKRVKILNVIESIPEDEKDRYVRMAFPGGFQWKDYSKQGLFTYKKELYFYKRLYWGKTFIIDIEDATLETDTEVAEHLDKHITEETKQLIKDFNGEFFKECDSCGGKHLRSDLTEALFVIKKNGIKEGKKLYDQIISWSDDGRHTDLKEKLDLIEIN